LRFQQRLLQRFGQINVGGFGAPERNATPRPARDVGGRAGHQLRLRGGVLEHLARNDGNVERVAACRQFDQLGGGTEAKDKLVAGGALELCAELF
jgi:hypothetical protein